MELKKSYFGVQFINQYLILYRAIEGYVQVETLSVYFDILISQINEIHSQ